MAWIADVFDCRCVGCGRWGEDVCDDCLRALDTGFVETRISGRTVLSVGRYEGMLRRLIRVAKHGGQRALVARLGDRIAALARALPATIAVPVPSSREGFRARGYGLARSVARATNLPVMPILNMVDTSSQRNRGRDERSRVRNLRVDVGRLPVGTRIILVDDVVTTGTTLRSAIVACERVGLTVGGALVLALAGRHDTGGKVLGKSFGEV